MSVVKARLEEIFDSLKKQLIVPGFNLTSGINLVLVGGGANLLDIDKYFVKFFGPNIKKINTSFNEDNNKELIKYFCASFGALKIIKDGWETEAIPQINKKDIEKKGFFSKFFGLH